MAAYGYLVYLLRASVPFRPKELQRLSELGDNGDDLVDVIERAFSALGSGYHPIAKSAEGFRVREVDRSAREVWARVNRGPQGPRGETYDLDTLQSVDTTERQALLSGLRALFVVPKDSYWGLLFVERIGGRHLKDLLERTVLEATTTSTGALIRVENFAEAEDWQGELAGTTLVRVSELLHAADGSEDASTPRDRVVRVVTEGASLRLASEAVRGLLLDRLGGRTARLATQADLALLAERRRVRNSDFTVQDEEEFQRLSTLLSDSQRPQTVDAALQRTLEALVPVNREGLDHKRYDVALESARGDERNFVLESNAIPQFVYPLGSLLPDVDLRTVWQTHANTIFNNLGVRP